MRRLGIGSAVLLAVLAGWFLHDFSNSSRHDLREFDSREIAFRETGMWRAYYGPRPLQLLAEMSALLRRQFHLPFWPSCVAAYHAARAAVVFQAGHNREEYLRALPDLVRYYSVIHRASTTNFDVPRVASLELEWWIVHRERLRRPAGDLDRSLAELASAIYQLPPERFAAHAHARAEAMLLRDDRASAGEVTDEDWRRIGDLLDASWSSLRSAF